jgi:hypothetical protein
MRSLLLIMIGLLSKSVLNAQSTELNVISARFDERINFDGKLGDSIWQIALRTSNFTQRELNYNQPSTEKTEVAIVYDKLALYIGIWCYQNEPGNIRSKFMQRDFDYDQDDNFQVALSPFNDKRNGYLFIVNPNGARADLLISGNEEANKDWNGVWDCKTSLTDEGWFAEIKIPFSTLQFKRDSIQTWGINFERNIRSKNEQVLWQGWTRDCSIFCLANAGTLTGLKNIGYVKRFELKPYALGGFEKKQNEQTEYPGKIGGDLNINLTPTLKFNLTVNTDFAQVEADRIAVNLSRFNLYYPEKREFFLEGYQNFQFYLGNDNQAFYTRRIGIENFKSVPIIAGGRLFGKIGRNNIGMLNIQTGETDNAKSTNNSVVRYKRDIGEQSYIGGIFTSKLNPDVNNRVAGIDGAYSTSHFLKNKNLVIGALLSQSFDKNVPDKNDYAWRFFIDYPNDLIDHFIGISSIQQNFNPALGFLTRSNYESFTWNMRYNPRWFEKYGIRKMLLKPWEFTIYRTQTTGEFESFFNESRPVGFLTKSGETFEFNLQQQYDRVDSAFHLSDSLKIEPGKYWMYRQELQLITFQGRKLWIGIVYNWGGYYSGKIKSLETSLGINLSKHFNLRTDLINNHIEIPGGNLWTNELAQYVNYAFTPRLDVAVFVQWNSLDDLLSGNFRLHWIPNIGSDFYLVYNRGYEQLNKFDFAKPAFSSGAAKLVWRIVF